MSKDKYELKRDGLSWVVLLLLSLSFIPFAIFAQNAKGKLTGEVNFSAGSNFRKTELDEDDDTDMYPVPRRLGDASLKIGYESERLFVEASACASSSLANVNGWGLSVDQKAPGDYGNYMLDTYNEVTQSAEWGASLMAVWRPDRRNRFDFSYNFSHAAEHPSKEVVRLNNIDDSVKIGGDYSWETVEETRSVHLAGIKYCRQFPAPGKELTATLDGSFSCDDKYTEWYAEKYYHGDVEDRRYRQTPLSYDNEVNTDVLFSEKGAFGVEQLLMEYSLHLNYKGDIDHQSAANCHDGVWVDSAGFRQDFWFNALTPEARVHCKFDKGMWHVDVACAPQWYLSSLSGNSDDGGLQSGSMTVLADVAVALQPWDKHTFSATFNRDVTRPDYLQICPFPRAGAYTNEVWSGNPDLRPSASNKGVLGYDYKDGRFSTHAEAGTTYEKNIIEETFRKETDGNVEKRVHSWVNAAESYETFAMLAIGWKGRHFNAGVTGVYNRFAGKKWETGAVTRSSDCSIQADASYEWKGWTVSAKGGYQSAIKRIYTSMTQVVGLDVRMEKKFAPFGKNGRGGSLMLFVEGRDLLDNQISKTTLSLDGITERVEMIDNNRRVFIAGAQYSF